MRAAEPAPPTALRDFLAAYPPATRQIALEARSLLLGRLPTLVETVWPGWKTVGYGTGPRMEDLIVGLRPAGGHLSLQFPGGVALPDPDGLLTGTGKSGRHVRITSSAMLHSPAVTALLDHAFVSAGKEAPAAEAKGAGGWQPPVSDESVTEKTGRTWDEWLAALDAQGCAGKSHKEIVAVLRDEFGIAPWWQQSVAVGYERARGLRDVHQTTAGYQVGASKTIATDLPRLWRAWSDPRTRKRWLPDEFTVRKATEPKSMRITWNDGTDLQVLFMPKGDAKSVVTIDHRKLPAGARVEEMKAYWKERLEALKELLEKR